MVETRPASLTYEDYLDTPDDERWELLRGELFMVPGPNTAHQTNYFKFSFALACIR